MDKLIPIEITDKAYDEIKNIIAKKNIPDDYGLRIGIQGAGCVGVSYLLGFDKKKEDDDAFGHKELNIYVSRKHFLYLAGMQIDFHEGADAQGFVFEKLEN